MKPQNASRLWAKYVVLQPVGNEETLMKGIDGDGRMDYINCYGWWEQPPPGASGLWTMHPQAFGRWRASQGGAEIAVYDVNGDKLNDIVTAREGTDHALTPALFRNASYCRASASLPLCDVISSALEPSANLIDAFSIPFWWGRPGLMVKPARGTALLRTQDREPQLERGPGALLTAPGTAIQGP